MANYSNTPVLNKIKIGTQTYWVKDADARALLDTVVADYLKNADKEELEAAIEALGDRVGVIEGDYLKAADKTELADAIEAEAERAAGVEAELEERIEALEEDAVKVKSDEKILAKNDSKELYTTLTINYDSTNRKIQLKGISGALVSEMSAEEFIKDGMLYGEKLITATATSQSVTIKDVTKTVTGLTVGHKYLVLCFSDGAKPTPEYSMEAIDVQDLVDVYTAGDGLALDDFEFSVVVDSASESFLTVGENGIKLAGVQTAINTAVAGEAAIARAAEEALDGKIDGVATDLASEVTRATDAEGELSSAIAAAEADIDDLQADVTTIKGKPAYNITASQITNWDNEVGAKAAVYAEADRAIEAEGAITDELNDTISRVDDIEGKEDGWDAKLDNIKINNAFKEVKSDVAGKGNYVDLGNIATADNTVNDVTYADGTHTLSRTKNGTSAAVHAFGDLADTNLEDLEVKGQTKSVIFTSADVTVKEYTLNDATSDTDATITSTSVTASKITNAAAVATPSFTEGAFTPASLTYDSGSFVKEGFKAEVKAIEGSTTDFCLELTAVTGTPVITAFSGGSKAADTFDEGVMPTFEDATATNVTKVTYKKGVLAGTDATKTLNVAGTVTTDDKAVTIAD